MAPLLILHIPHASLNLPERLRQAILLDGENLELELLRMTDRYTDELVSGAEEAARVVMPFSRLGMDVERFRVDADEPMAARGMGAIYTKTHDGRALRSDPDPQEREELSRSTTTLTTPPSALRWMRRWNRTVGR